MFGPAVSVDDYFSVFPSKNFRCYKMFDSNNNNVDGIDENNNTTIELSSQQSIGGKQEVFTGRVHERCKYKKELQCLRQRRDDENFVLLKSMDRWRMVCTEAKKATDRANGDRNKYRKLIAQLVKSNRVQLNDESSAVDLSGFGTTVVVSPKSASHVVLEQNSAVSSTAKVLTTDNIWVEPTSGADNATNVSSNTIKRKSVGELFSPLQSNKRRKTGAEKRK